MLRPDFTPRRVETRLAASQTGNPVPTAKIERIAANRRISLRARYRGFRLPLCESVDEFTPDTMSHWGMSLDTYNRDQFLLIVKSIAPLKSAESGIFNLQSPSYKGFQQGNPQAHQDGIAVSLFSDDGSIEVIFFQKDYKNSGGVTQPEINRIVRSLHKSRSDARD